VNLASMDSTKKAATDASIEPVRVLHLNAGNLYGGVETLLTTLARLRDLCPGMEPHFGICYEGRYSRELIEAKAPVYNLGPVRISQPWTVWRARRRLREILRRERFDIIVCHMPWSLAVFGPAVTAAESKLVFWAHGSYGGTGWLERLAKRVRPDVAVANSRFTASTVGRQFPSTPLRVVHCASALAETPEAPEWRARLRAEQRVDDRTTVILQVSRLEPWKGHLIHLCALSQLPACSKWVCWIAGGPQNSAEQRYLMRLRDTAHNLGVGDRVKFLGQRTDIPKLLAAADIFCQPNQEPEPFGLVFIEALWAGRPVVSSACGGAMEIVDESCGLLVTPGDQDSLAQSLGRLIDTPEIRQRLGSAGPARAHKLCDPAAQMEKMRLLFYSIVAQGTRRETAPFVTGQRSDRQ